MVKSWPDDEFDHNTTSYRVMEVCRKMCKQFFLLKVIWIIFPPRTKGRLQQIQEFPLQLFLSGSLWATKYMNILQKKINYQYLFTCPDFCKAANEITFPNHIFPLSYNLNRGKDKLKMTEHVVRVAGNTLVLVVFWFFYSQKGICKANL